MTTPATDWTPAAVLRANVARVAILPGRRGSNRLDTSRVRIGWASDLIYRALGDDECATVDEGGNLYEVAIG
ncbi:MAG: hypothetical protein WAV54_05145 [Acidimicrobiales bacterium]